MTLIDAVELEDALVAAAEQAAETLSEGLRIPPFGAEAAELCRPIFREFIATHPEMLLPVESS